MLQTNLRRSITVDYPVNEGKSSHRTLRAGMSAANERLILAEAV